MGVDQSLGRRAGALIEASRTLAELLERDPYAVELITAERPLPDAAGYVALIQAAFEAEGIEGLRAEKRRRLLEIAARDLVGELSLEGVGRGLAELTDACLEVAVASIEGGRELAVIGMGKLGGSELNYSSDIDLMFVNSGELAVATKAAATLVRELGAVAPEGQAYRIDLNLRPEGRSGALVRSLEGYLEYYRRWAKPWEFQALIKARACAGNRELGDAFVEQTRSLVFTTEISTDRIADIRKTKARVEEHAQRSTRRGSSDRDDVKLGPGGIRDIEFSVQLLQLVHGGSDGSVRSPTTLVALSQLVDGGYIADDDGAAMSVAYRWLRNVEHRLQLWQERQVHHLPTDEDQVSRLARTMGFKDSPRLALPTVLRKRI